MEDLLGFWAKSVYVNTVYILCSTVVELFGVFLDRRKKENVSGYNTLL